MATATQEPTKEQAALERAKRIIRGLLEKSEENSATEQEAIAAAEKVGEMMRRYDLTLDEVMLKTQSVMAQDEVYASDRAAQGVVTGIGLLCDLQTYHKGGQTVTTFVLYGHAHDIEVAKYLYEVVMEAMDHDTVKFLEKYGYAKAKRDSFRTGFAARIYQRMAQLKAQREAEARARATASNSTSLVVMKNQLVQAEFEKTGVKLVTTTRRVADDVAYAHGAAAGERVNLNSPLTNGRAGQAALR